MKVILESFDAAWYLSTYPDVAGAGVDPLQHYLKFGRKEGRLPFALPAIELEQQLWSSEQPAEILAELQRLSQSDSSADAALAAWVLARWYASFQQWQDAYSLLSIMFQDESALWIVGHSGPYLLAFSTYYSLQKRAECEAILQDSGWPDSPDKMLASSMLAEGREKAELLNQLFVQSGLSPLTTATVVDLDHLITEPAAWSWRHWLQPLVTVIIPCFNAQATICTALNSLSAQTHRNLQIIVVDDASTDETRQLVDTYAMHDHRVTLIKLSENSGAYVARNIGLAAAKGRFITTHDADDWSHPQKIELQVNYLRTHGRAQACVSDWVRCNVQLDFMRWRTEDSWIYRNVSSLMIRCSVRKKLGYWDTVSVNADTEYFYRLLATYGPGSIGNVKPGVPLAFGRSIDNSLSQHSATHLRTQFRGVRKYYMDSARIWHQSEKNLYLPAQQNQRPFPVPMAICRGSVGAREHNLGLVLQQKSAFDPQWYCFAYPDVMAAKVDPLRHFVRFGVYEGRNPNELFSLSAYALTCGGLGFKDALEHWLSQPELIRGSVYFEGAVCRGSKPVILCVAHLAGEQLFGAERSFEDIIGLLAESERYNLVIVLPSAANPDYVARLRQLCRGLYILPMVWWRYNRPALSEQFHEIQRLMIKEQVNLLYCNTLVHQEPLLAAESLHVPRVIHVREIPYFDSALCNLLQADAQQIIQYVADSADYIIANSETTAAGFENINNLVIIPNYLNKQLNFRRTSFTNETIRVGIVSSNHPKKGIDDFFAVAKLMKQDKRFSFFIYGPETGYIQHKIKEELLFNTYFMGYIKDPVDLYSHLDVVLSLSDFQESFGRSVAEAMQAGCAVIAYDWGAVSELISGDAGMPVPYKDIQAVCERLEWLAMNRSDASMMLKKALDRLSTNYSESKIASRLHDVFARLLNQGQK